MTLAEHRLVAKATWGIYVINFSAVDSHSACSIICKVTGMPRGPNPLVTQSLETSEDISGSGDEKLINEYISGLAFIDKS